MTEDEEALFLLTHEERKWSYKGQVVICCFVKNINVMDGECKKWDKGGELVKHYWYKDNVIVADFLEHPELKKEYGIDE